MTSWQLALLSRAMLAVLLLAAGLLKLRALQGFRRSINSTRLFTPGFAALLVLGVPLLEVFLAACLVLAPRSAWPSWGAIGVLGTFTGYLVVLQRLRWDAACGCFGSSGPVSSSQLLRNLGLVGVAVAGAARAHSGYWLGAGGLLLLASVTSRRRARGRRLPARAS
jgi:hypothetical protein